MCVRVYVSAHMGVFVRRWGTCTCLHMCTHGSGCGRVCVGTCVGLHVAYMHICGFCVWDSCACLYTCAHVGLWMWACLCRHMRGSLCMGLMHACMRVRTWVCACGCACLCMCTCVALCVCMHMCVSCWGGAEREKERENLKQAPHPAWSPTRGYIPQP